MLINTEIFYKKTFIKTIITCNFSVDKQKNKNVKYFPTKLKTLLEYWIIQESKVAFINML